MGVSNPDWQTAANGRSTGAVSLMSAHAVVNYSSLDAPVIIHQSKVIHLRELLCSVDFLAQKIPSHKYILNLYEDRYHFLLGFLLALKQQSISLFPSTVTAHVLEQLTHQFDDILVLKSELNNELNNERISGGLFPCCDLDDHLQAAENHQPSESDWLRILPAIELSREIAIIFTSGSTGQPKPYHKQWGDLVQVSRLLARQFSLEPSHNTITAILATVPAQHMYGLEASIMVALQNGLLLHSQKPFFPQDITLCLEELAAAEAVQGQTTETTLITTPLHLKACIKTGVSLPGIKQIISATAPLDNALALTCEQHYDTQVKEIFGCTEVGSMAWRRTIDSDQWTVLDDISLQANDTLDDIDIHTTRSIRQFPFNDVIELIDSQHFILKGRKEDLINLAGKRTSLSYLNHHLQLCDEVSDGCFYQDHSVSEGRLMAFVVLNQNDEKTSDQKIASIKETLKRKIEAIFLPKKIIIVDNLPRNATGKLPLAELKTLFAQQENP
jgi:acyl-coenzyme A synthetase/AMP-(fatty) acid ligase